MAKQYLSQLTAAAVVICITFVQAVSSLDPSDFDKCGTEKGLACFRHPEACSVAAGTCAYAATFTPYNGGTEYVTITAIARRHTDGDETNQYIAVGFSANKLMPDTPMSLCTYDWHMQTHGLRLAYSTGHAPPTLMSSHMSNTSMTMMGVGMSDNEQYFHCQFMQKVKPMPEMGQHVMPLDLPYYILMATGFAEDTCICMLVGWLLFLSSGIFFARYFKTEFANKEWFGLKIWFQMHRAVNLSGLACLLVGVACIVVAKGWTGPLGGGPWTVGTTHSLVGLLSTVLAVSQPFVALLRCHPGTARRPVFNWVHRSIGLGALFLAVVNICLATFVSGGFSTRLGDWPLAVVIIQCIVSALHITAFEIYTFFVSRSQGKLPAVYSVTDQQSRKIPTHTKLAILGSYAIVSSAVVITLIVMLFSQS